MKYKGEIAGFPQEIVEKMLERQVEQGNERDVSVFERSRSSNKRGGGFLWIDTEEGCLFWDSVILDMDFDVFFAKYPKKQYPRVMMVSNDNVTWFKRVVILEKRGEFMAWADSETIDEAKDITDVYWWNYAKEVEPEQGQIELTIDEIAEKYGVKPEQIKIKK